MYIFFLSSEYSTMPLLFLLIQYYFHTACIPPYGNMPGRDGREEGEGGGGTLSCCLFLPTSSCPMPALACLLAWSWHSFLLHFPTYVPVHYTCHTLCHHTHMRCATTSLSSHHLTSLPLTSHISPISLSHLTSHPPLTFLSSSHT